MTLRLDYPHIAAQWHPTLNGELTPEKITAASHLKAWWLGDCEHEWDARVYNRTDKKAQGCPYCAGKRILIGFNDLTTANPQIAAQWHPTLNGELMPEMVTASSNKTVWWVGDCGHEWKAFVYNRTLKKAQGCPYCTGKRVLVGFNDLSTANPLIAAQWHPTLNGELTPEMVTVSSGKKVWWKCSKAHEWDMPIAARTGERTYGCPICSGRKILVGFNDLATTNPALASEWHPLKNKDRNPTTITAGSGKKVWWQCSKGHEWKAVTCDRTKNGGKGSNCPTCAARNFVSRSEQEIADYLSQELGLDIEQSNRSLLKGRTEIDIYVPSKNLAVEYNGLYWHSTAKLSNPNYHLEKYEKARAAGIQLLQIWEDEWRNKPELVKRLLAHKLGVSQEPLVGARQTHVEVIPLAEARDFLNEYHILRRSNGSYYLGLRSKTNQTLVAVIAFVRRDNSHGLTLEISRYATSCRVPGGFTKLLKYVETIFKPSRLVTFADHCLSDGGLYASNGFIADKEVAPDYHYLVNGQRAHRFGYRLARFKSDPSLLWEPNLTETQLAQLNGLQRIYDAGKTRWTKTIT